MTSPEPLSVGLALRPESRLLSALKTAAFLLSLTALMFLLHLGLKPEFGFIFAGAFAIHLGLLPERRELGRALGFAAFFAALYLGTGLLAHEQVVSDWWVARVAGIGGALGCGSAAVLGIDAFWSTGEVARRAQFALQRAAVIPVFGMVAAVAMGFVSATPATTFDLYLYSFDDRLGFQASFLCGRLFLHYPWLHEIASLIYDALPLLPPLVLAISWRERRRLPFDPLAAFVAAGIVCFCLYQVCPGTAPAAVFGNLFPDHQPAASALHLGRIAIPDQPRNAMPSMHVTWTLLAWWCSLSLSRWMRIFSTVFLAWTVLATLGLGEHYLTDLIVACVFTLAISAGCAVRLPFRAAARGQALAFGSIVTLGWLLLLREGMLAGIPQVAAWILVAITLGGSVFFERRLIDRASN